MANRGCLEGALQSGLASRAAKRSEWNEVLLGSSKKRDAKKLGRVSEAKIITRVEVAVGRILGGHPCRSRIEGFAEMNGRKGKRKENRQLIATSRHFGLAPGEGKENPIAKEAAVHYIVTGG